MNCPVQFFRSDDSDKRAGSHNAERITPELPLCKRTVQPTGYAPPPATAALNGYAGAFW